MTGYRRGAVVLVPFPFTDLSAVKRRPALIVSNDTYNDATGDVIIAQITSKVHSPARPGDHRLEDWRGAGLPLPSLVRARMTTLHGSLLIRSLGTMPDGEMRAIDERLAETLGLSRRQPD
ncbi:MAG: type II toxin-antitoxin system PemK/MazF family toxin [Dehalococcoidia bacterium]